MSYYQLTDKLLAEGDCLTYRWLKPKQEKLWKQTGVLREEYLKDHPEEVCFVRNRRFPLTVVNSNFHYFSNGVLVHCFSPQNAPKRIERVRKMLAYYGYEVKQIYGPEEKSEIIKYYEILLDISEQTDKIEVDINDLELVSYKNPAEFIKYCFIKDSILLTAAKDATFIPERRQYVALFDNGLLVVSKDYKEQNSFRGFEPADHFIRCNRHLPMLEAIYVPQAYLDALYKEAEKYDWYISPEDVAENQSAERAEEKRQMEEYAENILKGRTCISVTIPRIPYMGIYLDYRMTYPEYERYVLFSDGKLVLSNLKHSAHNPADNPLVQDLKRCFPQMKFEAETVPDEYITYLLEVISKRQKSAHDIYIEMLKQKARKLKRIAKIQHVEALELVALVAGWKNWKEVLGVNETKARQLIAEEQDMELRAKGMGYGNSICYNGLKYLNLFESQNIAPERGREFFKRLWQQVIEDTNK